MIITILPLLNVEQCVVICSNTAIHITFAAWKEIFASSFIPSEFKPLFHYIPVLQIVTEIGSFYHVIIPSAQWSWMWLCWFHLVCPSVRLRIILHVFLRIMAGMRRIGNVEIFSTLWLKCGYNAEISPYSCPNTPICIFSAFPQHFFHIRTWRFLRVPVQILPSAFPLHFFPIFFPYKNAEISLHSCPKTPVGRKCGDLGYGYN